MNFNDEISRLRTFRDFGLNRLLAVVRDGGLRFHHERSARFHPQGLAATRALFSFDAADLWGRRDRILETILASMRMPEETIIAVRAYGDRASQLHFGFEEQFGKLSCKFYLELPFDRRRAPLGSVVFLGYKWAPQNNRVCLLNKYRLAAVGDYEECVQAWWSKVASLEGQGFGPGIELAPLRSAGRPLAQAPGPADRSEPTASADRGPPDPATSDYMVLEVVDDASARHSYDLKTYDRGMVVADLAHWLDDLVTGWGWGWDPEWLRRWLAEVGGDEVGHVAAGYGADHHPFLTIYHGARVMIPSPA